MKVVFSTSGNTLDAPLDRRFGRASNFLVYDTETESFTVVDNRQNLNASQGAGIQSAQTVAGTGAKHLVTGHCGPKAFRVLNTAGIAIYTTDAATVADALRQFLSGELKTTGAADVDSHWV
ncbi:MAG TPA: NifB/NifX family molybdenum-iron cluster-binding protein [Deltaproteobacteria bacterium]|nr:NifB/NifX family molybdenum-iron cluster-binding protein [Deltaproteobacteria bacterium]